MQQVKNISGVKVMPNKVAVRLGDGTIISISDLPPRDTTRWVASNKAAVVKVYVAGLIDEQAILDRYGLSHEELESWVNRYISGGKNALKVTKLRDAQAAQ